MNKPEHKPKENKRQVLIDQLYEVLKDNLNDQLLLKPIDDDLLLSDEEKKLRDFTLFNKDTDLEEYKKDYSSRIDRQMLIIALNISNSLFALSNEKFTAFMSRYDVWGFDLTMLRFIIDFYLVVKTDNMLRHFILSHMDKIIKTTRGLIEKYLIMHMGQFSFKEVRTDFNKKKVFDSIKQNQIDLANNMKDRDKTPINGGKTTPSVSTDSLTSSPTPNLNATFGDTEVGLIDVTPIDQIGGEGEGTEGGEGGTTNGMMGLTSPTEPGSPLTSPNEIPKIFSMDLMMNMSEAEKDKIGNNSQNVIPPIEDNMSNLINQPELGTNPSPLQPATTNNAEELQSEEEQQMEQLILANLKQQHQNLLRGVNG